MTLQSGNAQGGAYQALLPNPVVTLPSGAAVTVYYAIVAEDADPPLGCAHSTVAPATGVFHFEVTRP